MTQSRTFAGNNKPPTTPTPEVKEPTGPAVTREVLDSALAELPGDQTNPDYVVAAMRQHFGELFTEADEALIRTKVVAGATPAPAGLQPSDLQPNLNEGNISIGAQSSLSAAQVAQLEMLSGTSSRAGQALPAGFYSINKGFVRAEDRKILAKMVGGRYYFDPATLPKAHVAELERLAKTGIVERVGD